MRILQAAIEQVQAGQFEQAVATLESQKKIALKTPVGQNVLGDIHLRNERPRDALKAFDQALRYAPGFPEAHANRGVALQEMGRLEEALRATDRALKQRPGYPVAYFNRGNILRDMLRFEDAVEAFDKALAGRNDLDEARINRGTTYVDIGRVREAIADFRAVLSREPDNINALVGLSRAYRRIDERADASAAIERALRIDPKDPKARLEKSDMLRSLEKLDSALSLVEEIAVDHPDIFEVAISHAECLFNLKRHDEALLTIDRAISLRPQSPVGHITKALILGDIGEFDKQAQALRRAESLGAQGGSIDHVRGLVLSERKQFTAAVESFESALKTAPHDAGLRTNLGMMYLKLGRFREGWREYEWRGHKPDHPMVAYAEKAPRWKGEPLDGKRILIFAEQGHGDNIQFFRFVQQVAGRGGDVTYLVPKALVDILRPNARGVSVVSDLAAQKKYDYQISIMSLPNVLDITLENLPVETPYLSADPAYVEKWRERLGPGFKVGLIWQGNPKYGADLHRSIRLEHYRPLADIPDIRLISLQVFHGLDQLDNLPDGMTVERLGEEITNNPSGYREVAGAMSNLDLIVTSDTGPAHLSGAMGLPVWVALRDNPDWRWLVEGETSPWYPTMRVFRQQERGVWAPVFENIAAALRERLAGKADP